MSVAIAVTGGIGSGKSMVSGRLAEHGAVLADSDAFARAVVAPGTPGLALVAAEFGSQVLAEDGSLNRSALAAVVFADPAARTRLEAITHPLVRARFAEILRSAPAQSLVVNDIPLLTSMSVAAAYGLVIGVHAAIPERITRLVRRGLALPDAQARIAAQIPDSARRPLCDIWLANEGSVRDIQADVDRLWLDRLEPYRSNVATGRLAPRRAPTIVESDPSWPRIATLLRARISHLVQGARVDHIGSTAVPGLPADGVIDLQLTVSDPEQTDRWQGRLAAGGFPRVPAAWFGPAQPLDTEPALWGTGAHGNADPGLSINLYLTVKDTPAWRWALLFPAWLRADEQVRHEYLNLKRELALAHRGDADPAAYATAKRPWVRAAYPRGLAWANRTGWQPALDAGTRP